MIGSEQSFNEMSQTHILMANESSRVLAESPSKIDQSDVQLVDIFNCEQIQASPERLNAIDKESKHPSSPGTANFGDGLDSVKVMKTRSITKAQHNSSITEVENSVLQGQSSIYMNQEDQQIKETSEIH